MGPAGFDGSAAEEGHNRYAEDWVTGRARAANHWLTPRRARGSRNRLPLAPRGRATGLAFRGVDAQRILEEEFATEGSLLSTCRLLHRMQLSWLAPRPRHPEAEATAQAEFWQLWDCN